MTAVLGCIADDFTGGTDLAETLSRNGMRTIQLLGVPDTALASEAAAQADALVVALKIRTVPVEEAVSQALAALEALRAAGCRQFFWKYCSTFDSTPKGNIGPVAEALLQALGGDRAVVCPSFPENKRTVYQGYLFVGDRLLHETSMRSHPLTPMTDANLIRLMDAQSSRKSGWFRWKPSGKASKPSKPVWMNLRRKARRGSSATRCPTRICGPSARPAPGTRWSRAAAAWPRARRQLRHRRGRPRAPGPRQRAGLALVLAGSCSQATQAQVARFTRQRPGFALDPLALAEDHGGYVAEAVAFARRHCPEGPCIVYSTASPDRVAATQARFGREAAGAMIERALADIAAALVETGVRRILVAGGETSGAVVSRLGVRALRIGETIAPGVPWTETLLDQANPGAPHLALALKSGNFGGEDFFMQALGLLANAN